MKIDYDSLILFNQRKRADETDLNINVLGDFAPKSGNTSDIIINKQNKYFGEIGKEFSKGDLNILNLETVIDDKIRSFNVPEPRFVDSKDILSPLKAINTNLVTLANNKIFDNGPTGLKKTIKYLKEYNIDYVGADFGIDNIYKPYCITNGDTKLGILNIADGVHANEKYNNGVGTADLESYHVIEQIKKLKKEDHFIIIIVHAGFVFTPAPPPFIQSFYRDYIDCGADLVIGHHPHVVQGVEIYNGKAIFYSIGHFGIHRKGSRNAEKYGIMLKIKLFNSRLTKIKIIPFEIKREKLELLDEITLKNFKANFNKISSILYKPRKIENLWNIYAHSRHPMIEHKKVTDLYMKDFNQAKISAKTIATSFVNRNLTAYYCNSDDSPINNPEALQLLEEYSIIKDFNLTDKLFLSKKNIYNILHRFMSIIYIQLKKIKRILSV